MRAEPDDADTILRDPVADAPAPAPGSDPEPVVTHRVRIGGYSIPLDTALYVGRHPAPPRIAEPVAPRLITVPSPSSEVSRTHARIRQVGSSVVVTDLRSANGTVVIVPNGQPRALRQGESMVVPPGSAIDLGDGNLLAVEPGGAS